MKQSAKFSKVAKYYETGVWTKHMVANAVVKEWITSDEYKQITGEKYVEE